MLRSEISLKSIESEIIFINVLGEIWKHTTCLTSQFWLNMGLPGIHKFLFCASIRIVIFLCVLVNKLSYLILSYLIEEQNGINFFSSSKIVGGDTPWNLGENQKKIIFLTQKWEYLKKLWSNLKKLNAYRFLLENCI